MIALIDSKKEQHPLNKSCICKQCGSVFIARRKDAKYCPTACRKAAQLAYYNHRRKTSIKGTLEAVVGGCRSRAKKRGLECNIDNEFILNLFETQKGLCARTKVPLHMSANNTRRNTNPNTVSIDRIDSRKGYTKDNVELVTTIYNTAKNSWSHEDVLAMSQALLRSSR